MKPASTGTTTVPYDPQVGRWWSVDPVDEFFSPYCYVGNNPIMFIDPDGSTINVPEELMDDEGLQLAFDDLIFRERISPYASSQTLFGYEFNEGVLSDQDLNFGYLSQEMADAGYAGETIPSNSILGDYAVSNIVGKQAYNVLVSSHLKGAFSADSWFHEVTHPYLFAHSGADGHGLQGIIPDVGHVSGLHHIWMGKKFGAQLNFLKNIEADDKEICSAINSLGINPKYDSNSRTYTRPGHFDKYDKLIRDRLDAMIKFRNRGK